VKPFTVNLVVENINVTFEIDTGSQHSVISKKLYIQLFSHIKLKNNDISLSDYLRRQRHQTDGKNICQLSLSK